MFANHTQGPYTAGTLLKLFWRSDYRWRAFLLMSFVLVMTIILVIIDVILTTWYNYFYDALQDYQLQDVLDLLVMFVFIATVSIIFGVYRYYAQQYLALRWRQWLTEYFLTHWLLDKNYYYLENFDKNIDNPDQRIQEDIGSLVSLSLNLIIGIVSAITTIFAFIFVLWTLSGNLHLSLGVFGTWEIHGYLVWVGILYAILGTGITFKMGYPLVSLNFEQQRREANFRFAAIDLRSHAEHIALYRGEKNQHALLTSLFDGVLSNWYAIILRQKLLLWFTQGYNQISVLLPLVVALPNYFNKVFKLGGLIQALAAFGRIQDALSFIVNSYTTIAEWQAVTRRLLTFMNHVDEVSVRTTEANHFHYSTQKSLNITLKNVSIQTPRQQLLLNNINEELMHGKHYLIKGASGVGKSTFVRALANIWPFGAGDIILPSDNKKILFLPQTAYMPMGSLRSALLFPRLDNTINTHTLVELLKIVDLPYLESQLDEKSRWTQRLSPGELQRIAFVRLLLQKPDWVFLDETTSALDLAHEKALYLLIKNRLPSCSIVSVGHRSSLDEYHDVQINLDHYRLIDS